MGCATLGPLAAVKIEDFSKRTNYSTLDNMRTTERSQARFWGPQRTKWSGLPRDTNRFSDKELTLIMTAERTLERDCHATRYFLSKTGSGLIGRIAAAGCVSSVEASQRGMCIMQGRIVDEGADRQLSTSARRRQARQLTQRLTVRGCGGHQAIVLAQRL
ncbi:uncharacterized protein BDR25DRAFT_103047 [Lindgomyces ingoldianus]|uniref:Uncharacterized protein n=1 Tax=Lindgomyces ingoldianus TaxID=673940 RepID=A0ACB6R8K3_9PLEO|nr:uncharacterized protein BDR25DRAFT_103047 [Lindgomyces ingoldianus]KAF2475481.1 hypothetical protein BDR25DRAFT_103047 [Lindgomyces ingoldianus]